MRRAGCLIVCWRPLHAPTASAAFDFLLVRLLQRGKTPNVKWLEDVRGVRRHTEGNNLAFLAEILEFKRLVALVAVNNQ